ncbi:MAG: peptide chain release factor N(5)-glutamine methyltransferase [Pseudomonadota bacterium]
MTSRRAALAEGVALLEASGVPGAARDARLLYRWASGLEGVALTAALNETAGPEELARFREALAARSKRRPVSQIIGVREFWGRRFEITPDVHEPPPESETLIAVALRERAARVLDLGTGSGCLLLTLLAEWLMATGLGVDLSPAALAVAARNAESLSLAPRAEFRRSDWFGAVEGRFDLIVANPPYLTEAELADAPPELRHEPAGALSDGGDGLGAYRAILAGAAAHLASGGRMLLEIGATQSRDVIALAQSHGWTGLYCLPDLDGRDRVVQCRWETKS